MAVLLGVRVTEHHAPVLGDLRTISIDARDARLRDAEDAVRGIVISHY